MPYIPVFTVATLPPVDGSSPMPTPSEPQYLQFYSMFGATIATWQLIESKLAHLFFIATETGNYDALMAAFHEVTHFRGRLNMVNKAVLHSNLQEEIKDEWAALSERVRKKSLRRNELAHGCVYFQPARRKDDDQLFVAPMPSNPSKPVPDLDDQSDAHILTWKKLHDIQNAFMALNDELGRFFLKAKPLPTPLPLES